MEGDKSKRGKYINFEGDASIELNKHSAFGDLYACEDKMGGYINDIEIPLEALETNIDEFDKNTTILSQEEGVFEMDEECYFSNKVENFSKDSKEKSASISVKYHSPNLLIDSEKDCINKNDKKKSCNAEINFNNIFGCEKILFCKMIFDIEDTKQYGPAQSYKQSKKSYDSIKDVESIFKKHNLILDIQRLLEVKKEQENLQNTLNSLTVADTSIKLFNSYIQQSK